MSIRANKIKYGNIKYGDIKTSLENWWSFKLTKTDRNIKINLEKNNIEKGLSNYETC